MLTTPYVFNEDEADGDGEGRRRHHRLPSRADDRRQHRRRDGAQARDCPALVDAWAEAALKVNPDVIILVHGGPVAMPADAEFILNNTSNCHGFYGASSMERLPTEIALTEQTRMFKRIARQGRGGR